MYRNKKDVDKHVESLMLKLSPKDFKTRAYSIARLYYEVGDYGSCQKYVEQYLTLKSNNAAAHKLLGHAFQKLGEKDKALEQFKISLDIDPTQTSTILDVCELLADDEVVIDSGRARYWCEKAVATFPKHPVTFRLKERLLALGNSDPEALIKLLKTEIEARPKDVVLHNRLLKHYLNSNLHKEAFDHCCKIEFDSNSFSNNYAWYETLSEILKYNPLNINDWLYQLLFLTVKERICVLSLTEIPNANAKSLIEANEHLYNYDQAIATVAKTGASPGYGEFHTSLLQHHRGQLALHAATYLLKKAKKDHLNWRDAINFSAPLMLIAWQTIPLDTKVNWLTHAPEKQKAAVSRWYKEGSFRCSQSGHYLLSNTKDKSQVFLDQISQFCSGIHWKDKLYEKIFTAPDQLTKIKSSCLASNLINNPAPRLPRKIEVQAYDDDAQREYPNSLHHFVWILLNYRNIADFKCTLFDMFTPTMASCGPETLNRLDVLAFLYCSTVATQQQKNSKSNYISVDSPDVLPANITDLLCSLPQMKWWDCAYKLSQNELGFEYTDIRTTLSRGIEIVRCVDNHGIDPELLCILGRIFSEQAQTTSTIDEKTTYEQRACLYYSSAIPLLEKLKCKVSIKLPERRMFEYTLKELETKELNNLIEESKLYVALNHLNDGEYEKVINLLSNLKSHQAYYHLSKTYKRIALEEKNLSKTNDEDPKYATLLSKAKHFAYKALDKIKELEMYKNKPLYANIQELIEEIESHLNRVDPNLSASAINEIDSSDENVSEIGMIRSKLNHHRNVSSTPKQSARNTTAINVTAYRTATESNILDNTHADQLYLERIEKEIKNLQKRDSTINDFMEQTRDWFQENRKLGNQIINTINSNMENTTEQFKILKISMDQVKDQIDECRNECKDVVELKKQIAELKKEVIKLKKTSSEQAIDESDLYNLDDDYRSNDNTSNFGAHPFTTPQMVPPFPQRLVPPFTLPSNPYQLYGQNLYNLFNQYSQFAQPSTVPGAPQMFDPTRTQMNYPGVYPTPDQMYLDVAHLVPPTMPPVPTVPTVPNIASTPSVTVAPPSVTMNAAKTSNKPDSKEVSKSLPVNVVITSSDPLPTQSSAPPPVLSVTIPQKHIKGSPHNYQIAMPPTSEAKVGAPPLFSFPSSGNNKPSTPTTSSTFNWNAKTMFTTSQAENTLSTFSNPLIGHDKSQSVVDGTFTGASPNTSLNKSRTLSEKSNTSIENYDPCPDFKPIIPLPAEVKVTTGEEDEMAIFSARAKLFRFVDKQWKERGIGEMKLLKHKVTGKVRVLMRREQVHKICANHIILPEMEIKPMKNETKAYFWVANDFAEETVILEKFCIRFKTADIAKDFYESFEKARQEAIRIATVLQKPNNISRADTVTKNENPGSAQPGKTVVGGFTFSAKPTFKTATPDSHIETKTTETPTSKVNVFSGLTFKPATSSPFSNVLNLTPSMPNKTDECVKADTKKINTSDLVEDFESTAEFKPVIPLPALVDQKTGEEDETVLFEHRAKLLRFDAAGKEWKERGLGNIKLLAQKDNSQKIRLLMRREQIMKVCCNHSITKEMTFQKMPNMEKAVTWCAKDFSEGELIAETFCLRFKTVQACNDFMDAIKNAQSKIGDDTKAAKEEQNAAKQSNQTGFGDKFKPKAGSWYCNTCYTNNLESFTKCACCETPKPAEIEIDSCVKNTSACSSDWGDKFKPKPGSWECKECLIRNESSQEHCNACNSPRDPTIKKPEPKVVSESAPKFNFGIPSTVIQNTVKGNQPTPPSFGWGDKFKPKEGSWECNQCFVRNESFIERCGACGNPKNPSTNVAITSQKEQKIMFGIPKTSGLVQTSETPIFNTNSSQKFSFGIPQNKESAFGVTSATNMFATTKPTILNENPINFSIKKNEEESITVTPVKPALLPTPKTNVTAFGKESGTFEFSFKPKTPTKGKSPIKSPKDQKGDESDENEYASEDEGHHIHFSPVIPMPDKIEVVTGEENEEELYGHRAKLYIFTNGEWKERGLGIVKILKHKVTGKLRVVMRREQVHKICLNHALVPDILYKPKDDRTWLFVANDFSEGEVILQNFCLRFQNKEIALQFKEVKNKALKDKYGDIDKQQIETEQKNADSEDVIFIQEIQASNEDKQKAKELMLPENFYTYKNKEPCQGCRGCDSEDIKSESDKDVTKNNKSILKLNPNFSSPLNTSTFNFQSPTTSIFGTPTSLDKTVDTAIFSTPLGAIGSNTKFSSASASNNSTFGDSIDKENTFIENKMTSTVKPIQFVSTGQIQISNATKSSQVLDNENKTMFGSTEVKSIFGDNKSIFGDKKPVFGESKSIFGDNTFSLSENKSVIGENKSVPNETKSIFGESKSVFGESKSIFTENKPVFSENKSLFGENKSVFGDNKPIFGENKSVFGDSKTLFGDSKSVFGNTGVSSNKSIFGSNQSGKGESQTSETASIFSDTKPSSNLFSGAKIFGTSDSNINKSDTAGIFGATSTFKFGNTIQANQESDKAVPFGITEKSTDQTQVDKTTVIKTETKAESTKEETPFKIDNTLTFAALSSSGPAFGIQKNTNFQWEGAGQQLFTGASKKFSDNSKNGSTLADDSNASAGAGPEEEYDPHYEPIVPLPDKIVVTTGEEDEQKLYGERCKLYRFDEKTREWKERGVGEMKLLYHPERNSYRLLLRRELIHKAVLNMLLFMDLELLPMKNSDRAWTWAGRNYAESAGEQETLAVRFKSVELATAFHDKIMECVRKLQVAAADAIRKEQEEKEKQIKSIAPLRLPKHLGDGSRADDAIASTTRQTSTKPDPQTTKSSEEKQNGEVSKPSETNESLKQVHFEEPEEDHGDYDEDYENNYDHNEDSDGYYNDEEEESTEFYPCKAVVVQDGTETVCEETQVQVSFDHEICSPKILVTDANTGEILADMLIHTDTEFQLSDSTCTWSGVDFTTNVSVDKTVSITFVDGYAAMEFYDSCETSKAATYASTDPES